MPGETSLDPPLTDEEKEEQNDCPTPIYLDYNATTPLAPEVVQSIQLSLREHWGNPSSCYPTGSKAKAVVETSRRTVAEMVRASPNDIIFTSGGTEANHLAIVSATTRFGSFVPHVITSNVEHDSVIKPLIELERAGTIDLSIAPVDVNTGVLKADTVIQLITPSTSLITIMHANNETGVIMPIAEIGGLLEDINKSRQYVQPVILFHTDAAQTIGKIEVDVTQLKVDYLTIVGHKFYGPRIGALYARNAHRGATITPVFHGGGQERGLRPGTENTPMINGLSTAANLVKLNINSYTSHMEDMRNLLQTKLKSISGVEINFDPNLCLPNTLSVSLPEGHLASNVLASCSKINASLGAACHSTAHNECGSSILISSGLTKERATRTIRFSVGRSTTPEELTTAVDALASVLNNPISPEAATTL